MNSISILFENETYYDSIRHTPCNKKISNCNEEKFLGNQSSKFQACHWKRKGTKEKKEKKIEYIGQCPHLPLPLVSLYTLTACNRIYTKLSKSPPALQTSLVPSLSLFSLPSSRSPYPRLTLYPSLSLSLTLSLPMTLLLKRSHRSVSLARIASPTNGLPLEWVLLSALSRRHNQWLTSRH